MAMAIAEQMAMRLGSCRGLSDRCCSHHSPDGNHNSVLLHHLEDWRRDLAFVG